MAVFDGLELPGPQPEANKRPVERRTAAGLEQRRRGVMGGILPDTGQGGKGEVIGDW